MDKKGFVVSAKKGEQYLMTRYGSDFSVETKIVSPTELRDMTLTLAPLKLGITDMEQQLYSATDELLANLCLASH